MLLKRKRSESEFSFSSAFSSPSRPEGNGFDFGSMPTEKTNQTSVRRFMTPEHLPLRTMKRFRDNRPSEAQVHRELTSRPPCALAATDTGVSAEHTLDLLYSAQQPTSPNNHPYPPQLRGFGGLSLIPEPAESSQTVGQRSLHNFWTLPGTPPASPAWLNHMAIGAGTDMSMHGNLQGAAVAYAAASMTCEDCGTGVGAGDDVMDVDESLGGHKCEACDKLVCFSCSVGNLGVRRRCLVCAR